jgi:hypothetical protein
MGIKLSVEYKNLLICAEKSYILKGLKAAWTSTCMNYKEMVSV